MWIVSGADDSPTSTTGPRHDGMSDNVLVILSQYCCWYHEYFYTEVTETMSAILIHRQSILLTLLRQKCQNRCLIFAVQAKYVAIEVPCDGRMDGQLLTFITVIINAMV